MPTISHVRGALLEEVLLHFLRGSGYRIVNDHRADPTLCRGVAGLEVFGRGCKHQIDAIADFQVPHPFSHPQRLLVEAKCYAQNKKIGVEVVRNAVGVLKDVSEFWVTNERSGIPKNRYHYQYALFSATPYTSGAQRYAFAQDVYLIPVADSAFLTSVIHAIRSILPNDFSGSPSNLRVRLSTLRNLVRNAFIQPHFEFPRTYRLSLRTKIEVLLNEARRINFALLAMLGGSFPVFLVPHTPNVLPNLPSVINVRIFWDERGWYLESPDGTRLFSFDLPKALFDLYATTGILTRESAIGLKEDMMKNFYAFLTMQGDVRVIRFQLDADWLAQIRSRRTIRRIST